MKSMCPNCGNGCSGNCLKEPVPKEDVVNAPYHYTNSEIECIDAIKASLTKDEFRGFCKGNIMKYVWRERNKGELESLKKAQWYLNRLVKEVENA